MEEILRHPTFWEQLQNVVAAGIGILVGVSLYNIGKNTFIRWINRKG